MALTGSSISMVPETVGVRMRRNQTIRADSTNCSSAEMTTRVTSSPGPLRSIAAMQGQMKAVELLIINTWPEPIRP